MKQFPKDFLWGAAASAPQYEGADLKGQPVHTVWDMWHAQEPERFFGGVGPKAGADFNRRFREDIETMQATGFNSFRTSISWARLMPDGLAVCEEAVAFYREVFQTMRCYGIEPIVGLFHFDTPSWLYARGGWTHPESVSAFERYAATCFQRFGDVVHRWVTFNEPIVPVEMGYLNTYHLPGVKDMRQAVQVAIHTALAHKAAVKAFRTLSCAGTIGIVLNLTPTYPRVATPEDVYAAKVADGFFNRFFLDVAVKGRVPEICVEVLRQEGHLPECPEDLAETFVGFPVDFLGVNYYHPRRVAAGDGVSDFNRGFAKYFTPYQWPEAVINPYRGWEIYPKGLYDIAIDLRDHYGNIPWYVSENGMGVEDEARFKSGEGVVDTYRIDFYKAHLNQLYNALEAGANCFGYHVWTFVDNWSWLNAYKNRYGLYEKDLQTFVRRPKRSAHWFKALAESGCLKDGD